MCECNCHSCCVPQSEYCEFCEDFHNKLGEKTVTDRVFITLKDLEENEVCDRYTDIFKELFPTGTAEVTEETALRVIKRFNWMSVATLLLDDHRWRLWGEAVSDAIVEVKHSENAGDCAACDLLDEIRAKEFVRLYREQVLE